MKTHIRTVHEGHKEHKCESCGIFFTSTGNLKQHIDTVHEKIKHHKCNSCGKLFFKLTNLQQHVKTVHNGQKDYKCDSCTKLFTSSNGLKNHVRNVHKGFKDYECNLCGKEFSLSSHVKRHILAVHNGEKIHECDSCGKSFSQASDLKQHVIGVHERIKDHKCDSCGNSFSKKRALKIHYITMHSQIQTHPNRNINLKSEMTDDDNNDSQIHLPEFPHNLKSETDFSQPGSIKLKIKIPKQEPSDLFNCHKCNENFDSQIKLSMHKKRDHQQHNFKCGKCDRSYKSQSGLEFHEELQHPVGTSGSVQSEEKNITDIFSVKSKELQLSEDESDSNEDENIGGSLKINIKKEFFQNINFDEELQLSEESESDEFENVHEGKKINVKKEFVQNIDGQSLENVNESQNFLLKKEEIKENNYDYDDIIMQNLDLPLEESDVHEGQNNESQEMEIEENILDIINDIDIRNYATPLQYFEPQINNEIISTSNNDKEVLCNICHLKFSSENELILHKSNNHLNESLLFAMQDIVKFVTSNQ